MQKHTIFAFVLYILCIYVYISHLILVTFYFIFLLLIFLLPYIRRAASQVCLIKLEFRRIIAGKMFSRVKSILSK